MSNGELIAWQAGADWWRSGRALSQYANASVATLVAICGPDVGDAVQEMGRDIFGHWFHVGIADALDAGVKRCRG